MRAGRQSSKKNRRVIEELVLDAGTGDRFLRGQVGRVIIGELRLACARQIAGGVKADEIGGRRRRERHDPAMRAGHEKGGKPDLDDQQHQGERAHQAAAEPIAADRARRHSR